LDIILERYADLGLPAFNLREIWWRQFHLQHHVAHAPATLVGALHIAEVVHRFCQEWVSGVLHLVNGFRRNRWRERPGTFNHQSIIKHLYENVHISHVVRPMDASVDDGFIPRFFRIFWGRAEEVVLAEPREFADLRT